MQNDREWPKTIEPPAQVQELAGMVGGTIKECFALPDGSGGAMMSMPLPENHWIYGKDDPVHPIHGFTMNPPPMPFRMGSYDHIMISVHSPDGATPDVSFGRKEFAEIIRKAGRYAVRASTMDGKETDFDPDAMLQNLVVAFLGYWTANGLSSDDWANPPQEIKDAE